MTVRSSSSSELLNVEVERSRFRNYAETKKRFSSATYRDDVGIDHRTNLIFHTFDRTLRGRGSIPEDTKAAEKRCLYDTVRREVVYPLLRSRARISESQTTFDAWHKDVVQTLKATCPIRWNHGPTLTVGMVQKIINLHCKSLWTLEAVPDRYSKYFHATIDSTTLEHILGERRVRWTQMDSYDTYMRYQLRLRQLARLQGTYPIVLECWNWSRNRRAGEID
jgi:hypothetical protein